ncbi:thioredoxin-like protein [Pilobolus umbonatus]|nr:thioredoxin-like protein [Pilobolus umbonatus]
MDTLDILTEQQRRTLNQYQSITQNEDIEEAVRTLIGHKWNLEAAIQNRYNTTLYDVEDEEGSPSTSLLGNRASPPIPPRSLHTRRYRLKNFFMWPFNLVWNVSWSVFQFAARLFYRPAITYPRRDPFSDADRFLRDFESTYGNTHPHFFEGGYTQALKAAKTQLKYLIVILQSDEHDDTDHFCRHTLTSPELLEFLHNNEVIIWGGNVRNTEAFQVSNTLQATTYPFLAIISLQSSTNSTAKMTVIDRIEGPISATNLIHRLETAFSRAESTLSQLRRERDQRERERLLREQQESAYRESLRKDQEKEERARLAKEKKKKEEEARLMALRNRDTYIQYLRYKMSHEMEGDNVTRISFRLGNGDRVIHKFNGDDSLESLYQFVEIYPYIDDPVEEDVTEPPRDYVHNYKFTIHSTFPRREYLPDASVKIKDEKELWPSATLIVDVQEDDS